MNRKKLGNLIREMKQMRRAPQSARSLESLASRLRRKKYTKRGKEPLWVSDEFPHLPPVAIPHHGGRDLAPGTRDSILDQLEDDVHEWDAKLADGEDSELLE